MIAGVAKGRRLKAPPGRETRPSGDKLKEALFSSLGEAVSGASVLDLFAGTGALGIEALSRGAAFATFVEKQSSAAGVIAENLERTGLAGKGLVVQAPVERYLASSPADAFDLVLLDPPYVLGLPSSVLEMLQTGGFVRPGSIVVAETPAQKIPFEPPPSYALRSEKRYGDSALVTLEFRLKGA